MASGCYTLSLGTDALQHVSVFGHSRVLGTWFDCAPLLCRIFFRLLCRLFMCYTAAAATTATLIGHTYMTVAHLPGMHNVHMRLQMHTYKASCTHRAVCKRFGFCPVVAKCGTTQHRWPVSCNVCDILPLFLHAMWARYAVSTVHTLLGLVRNPPPGPSLSPHQADLGAHECSTASACCIMHTPQRSAAGIPVQYSTVNGDSVPASALAREPRAHEGAQRA